MSLQKKRIKSVKNVIFSLLCILVDRPMGGGLNPQNPPPAYALAVRLNMQKKNIAQVRVH